MQENKEGLCFSCTKYLLLFTHKLPAPKRLNEELRGLQLFARAGLQQLRIDRPGVEVRAVCRRVAAGKAGKREVYEVGAVLAPVVDGKDNVREIREHSSQRREESALPT